MTRQERYDELARLVTCISRLFGDDEEFDEAFVPILETEHQNWWRSAIEWKAEKMGLTP